MWALRRYGRRREWPCESWRRHYVEEHLCVYSYLVLKELLGAFRRRSSISCIPVAVRVAGVAACQHQGDSGVCCPLAIDFQRRYMNGKATAEITYFSHAMCAQAYMRPISSSGLRFAALERDCISRALARLVNSIGSVLMDGTNEIRACSTADDMLISCGTIWCEKVDEEMYVLAQKRRERERDVHMGFRRSTRQYCTSHFKPELQHTIHQPFFDSVSILSRTISGPYNIDAWVHRLLFVRTLVCPAI